MNSRHKSPNVTLRFLVPVLFLAAICLTAPLCLAQDVRDEPTIHTSPTVEPDPATGDKPRIEQSPPKGLHAIHIGYDKKTGKSPDAGIVTFEDHPELRRYYQDKAGQIDATRLTFRSGLTLHPPAGMTPGVANRLANQAESGTGSHYVIQFAYPFPTEARLSLEKAGVVFYDYLDVSGLYAGVPPGAAQLLQDMMDSGLVRYVGEIPPEGKLAPGLAAKTAGLSGDLMDIVVLTFEQPGPAELDELAGLMTIIRRSDGPVHIIEGQAGRASLQTLARLDYVRWVEERTTDTPTNVEGNMNIGADIVKVEGYDGSGVNVMVIDTGIAQITGPTYHPDFQADRILDQYDYQEADGTAEDAAGDGGRNGHGTHVAGTVAGRFDENDENSEGRGQGMAPGADLLIYKLCCGDSQFSETWFQQALQRGTSGGRTTHVSNNSWGGSSGYNIKSEIADRAVRGEYNNQTISMVFSAGNSTTTVQPPGTAKNAITVGSVKDGNHYGLVSNCGGVNDYNWPPANRVCYSNYGPLDTDGDDHTRVKPDLVAPGAMIYSAYPWYLLPGSTPYYDFKDGTSMAAPQVSGGIALILEAYPLLRLWPEAVKAMLIAAAVEVGQNYPTLNHYGHGLVDVYHTIYYQTGINEKMEVWGGSLSNSLTGELFNLDVPAGFEEVRVVLTWADPAGVAEVANDLNILVVRDGDDTICGSALEEDETVEVLKITPDGPCSTPGTWDIFVWAQNLSTPPQSFALAAHTILAEPDLDISVSAPLDVGGMTSFPINQYISNSGYTAGGSYVRLKVPDGFRVVGARLFAAGDDWDHSHSYGESDIQQTAGSGYTYFRFAVGSVLAGYPRHVQWTLRAEAGTPNGLYTFESGTYWQESGSLRTGGSVSTKIGIGTEPVFLPAILKNNR